MLQTLSPPRGHVKNVQRRLLCHFVYALSLLKPACMEALRTPATCCMHQSWALCSLGLIVCQGCIVSAGRATMSKEMVISTYHLISSTIIAAFLSTMLSVTWTAAAGSVCCVAWKDDHQFATASADHVIHLHSGDQACTATLRGDDATDLTHLTWSPNGDHRLSLIVMLFHAGKSLCYLA